MSDPFLAEFWQAAPPPWNTLGPEIAAGMETDGKKPPTKCTRWAQRLREERLRRGLSQKAVGDAFGASDHYIRTAELNIASPDAKIWTDLAAFYGITLE